MLNFSFLLDSTGNAAANPLGGFGGIIMIIVLFVALYFFMIRPQKKQEKRDAEMRDSLAVGDEVTTIGGIIGKVVSIKGETFVLETTREKTKIRFLKGAIRTIDVKAEALAQTVIESQQAEAQATEEPSPAQEETPEEGK
ncbi:MAG: preprotein translocase subunit YajC [Clostridia bacterium]|nr:preprotein translocase subunit YajC [Clostridia bacterium]